ncbi:hypothetical protein GCM10020000_78330 [Streptomyces olivoverticillatus]
MARMRLIVDFHEGSVAGRGNLAGDAVWADTISDAQRRTDLRMVYWDGISHTSAAERVVGLAPERGRQASVGSALRERYGARYVSVAIGFHHGDLGVAVVPELGRGSDRREARRGGSARTLAGPAQRRRTPPMGRTGEGPCHQRRVRPVP